MISAIDVYKRQDVTFVFNCLLTAFINNCLLFWCEAVIDILIDAEEQTVINCIPHGAVRDVYKRQKQDRSDR